MLTLKQKMNPSEILNYFKILFFLNYFNILWGLESWGFSINRDFWVDFIFQRITAVKLEIYQRFKLNISQYE